jgi:hypothetical protein
MKEFGLILHRNWNLLATKTKRRWWNETQYGMLEPSDMLKQDILAEISALAMGCEKSTTEGAGDAEDK